MKFNILDDRSGAVAIIIALAMSAILGMLLLTFDLGQQQTQKFNTQGAADASVLMAAQVVSELRIKNQNNNNPTTAELRPRVIEAFKANSKVGGDNDQQAELDETSVEVTYLTSSGRNYPDRIRVDGCFLVDDRYNAAPTQEGSQKTDHKVCSYAVANLATFGNAEIVFALDVSASMNQIQPGSSKRRIELLQEAVNNTVNGLVASYGGGSDILPETYWGVVPFRGMVDLGTSYSHFVVDDSPTRNSQLESDEALAIIAGAQGMTDANLAKLKRIPLTARDGDDVKNFVAGDSTDVYSDNSKFLSYGSHPWDYYMSWEKEACCGYCKTYESHIPYYEGYYEDGATCTPNAGCNNNSSSSSGGPGPGGPPAGIGGGGSFGGGPG